VHARVLRSCNAARRETLQIGAGAESVAFSPEHGDIRRLVGVKGDECVIEGIGVRGVDGAADVGARLNDG
jgi:hypothetical protein